MGHHNGQFPCHVLKALFFIKIALKLSYFCKKMQNFRALGIRAQTPVPPTAGAFAPSLRQLGTPPPDQPHIANFWLRAWLYNAPLCINIISNNKFTEQHYFVDPDKFPTFDSCCHFTYLASATSSWSLRNRVTNP